MSDHDKTTDNPSHEDAQAAASKLSQVSGDKKFKLHGSMIHWVVGAVVVLIIIAMVFSGGHKKQAQASRRSAANTQDYTAQLQANLARLKKANEQAKSQLTHFGSRGNQQHDSKQTLARQNQPTSMYSEPPASGNQLTSQDASVAQQATFAGKSQYDRFGNQNTLTRSVSARPLAHPHYTIASGEFVHATLETAINSDLPGMVRAVITEPVYAYVGERPLIPAGSRLIGQYSSAVLQGQNRIMVVWNRIILPRGTAVQVNSPGTDALGRAGQGADHVNTHFLARFGESALISLIGAGAAIYGVGSNDQYNSAAQYRMGIAQSFQQSAQNSLKNTLPMKPTLQLYQGAQINVFVAHDLSFYNVLRNENALPQSYTK